MLERELERQRSMSEKEKDDIRKEIVILKDRLKAKNKDWSKGRES
jgi:hypothetical protein